MADSAASEETPARAKRRVKNTKAKGSRAERRSMKLLEAAGYCCTKSGASLGVFDVIGISATDFVLVQCKSNRVPPPHEVEQIREFKVPPNARKLIHVYYDGKRQPRVIEVPAS